MAYDDKTIMEDMLSTEKFISGNYNTFANERAGKTAKNKLVKILNDEHDIQFKIFEAMSARGWYPTPAATRDKINRAVQMYAPSATNLKTAGKPVKKRRTTKKTVDKQKKVKYIISAVSKD